MPHKSVISYLLKESRGGENLLGIGEKVELLCGGEERTSDRDSNDRLMSIGCFRSKKAGFRGMSMGSILQVNMATISDIGGLKLGFGWRHKKAT